MYHFFVTIHARGEAAAGPAVELKGRVYQTLRVAAEKLSATSMALSFEEATASLQRLERMYCEPDGSFVWVSRQGEPPWQVDGNLFDKEGRLVFVDLKGTCPEAEFNRLLAALGWPETPLVFHLTREAILLDEAEFRRHAGQNPLRRPE